MDLTLENLRLERPGYRLHADLRIGSGDAVAILGPSGAGKSTLLNLIAGFETPTEGRLRFGAEDLTDTPPAARPVSMVFQDNNLFPHLTVAQNVGLGRDPALRLTAADKAAVEAVLTRVGLAGYGTRRPAALSGGEQSRVALARALLRDRPVLLLDEPFSALGPAMRADMLGLVSELRTERGLTMLMVTHDPADARRAAPMTIVVADGQAQPPAPTEALLAAPPASLRAYLGPDRPS